MSGTKKGSYSDYVARGFHPGSIVRVAMRNFLTYSDTVAYPGPELNVVLGPNGTGKSALTHAICLACGGAPKAIGRSDDITQFVKKGSEHEGLSYCEVDILTRDNVRTIRREINHETKSSRWKINNKPSTQKDVKEFMTSYNIDVNNLNSFMPQDKVGSFTQQTPKGILHETLQCIELADGSNRTLADEQDELATFQSADRVKRMEVNAKKIVVETLTRDVQSMEAEVQRMRQRTAMKELLELYRIKSAVVEAMDCEALVTAKQKEVNDAAEALNKAQTEIAPLESRERELKVDLVQREKQVCIDAVVDSARSAIMLTTSVIIYIHVIDILYIYSLTNTCITLCTHQVQSAVNQLGKSDVAVQQLHDALDESSVRIENTVGALGALDQTRRHQESQRAVREQEVDRIEHLKAQAEKDQPVKQELMNKLTNDLRAAEDAISESANEFDIVNMRCAEKRDEITNTQQSISSFADNSQAFLRRVPQRYRDVHRAYEFVRRNAHQFRGEVFGPGKLFTLFNFGYCASYYASVYLFEFWLISHLCVVFSFIVGMYIKAGDDTVARMVESFVAQKYMLAFICEREEDFDFLMREVRGNQRLKINFYHMKNPEALRGPYSPDLMREVGQACGGTVRYLCESVPAPSHMPVLVSHFLHNFSMFHKAIVLTPDPR
jgi:hypothetical protein